MENGLPGLTVPKWSFAPDVFPGFNPQIFSFFAFNTQAGLPQEDFWICPTNPRFNKIRSRPWKINTLLMFGLLWSASSNGWRNAHISCISFDHQGKMVMSATCENPFWLFRTLNVRLTKTECLHAPSVLLRSFAFVMLHYVYLSVYLRRN